MSKSLSQLLAQHPSLEHAFSKPQARPVLPCKLYAPGLPVGSLIQLQGEGRTEAFLQLLVEHPQMKAAWVEERLSAYPPAFVQQGVNLNLLLFVQGGQQFNWALAQLVRSQIFPVIAVASPLRSELELKRLQLAAEKSGCIVLILADIAGPAWPIKLWLETSTQGGPLQLRESRHQIQSAS